MMNVRNMLDLLQMVYSESLSVSYVLSITHQTTVW